MCGIRLAFVFSFQKERWDFGPFYSLTIILEKQKWETFQTVKMHIVRTKHSKTAEFFMKNIIKLWDSAQSLVFDSVWMWHRCILFVLHLLCAYRSNINTLMKLVRDTRAAGLIRTWTTKRTNIPEECERIITDLVRYFIISPIKLKSSTLLSGYILLKNQH